MRRTLALAVVLAIALPGAAFAAFPYPTAPSDPADYTQYKVGNETPNDLAGKLEWMYSATPDTAPESALNNASPFELGGVRGGHLVDAEDSASTAWKTSTGRPDVAIAVLDSGIKWDDRNAMIDLRRKTRISRGEAKVPNKLRGGSPLEPLPGSMTCDDFVAAFDANGDGVFNVSDYACDSRVEIAPAKGVGPDDLLDPQDVLIAFTDGTDDDGNGFKDDMVGWDFLDDDNDPYDDVQYGHGTGEARDSTAEADNGGELGACANCMSIHMRVGDSFVADVNRYAQAVVYAVDNDVLVVQEALGTLNNSKLARQATRYAYDHGVVVIASAADEAAQHNNWPSSLPGVILVNSVTKFDEVITPNSRSYLQFTGCTNFNPKITVSIPSVSCSSDATGRGSGMAGIIYSAALNAVEEGRLDPHPSCERTNGDPCPISPNEVRQLMATGQVNGQTQVDDVDFAPDPEVSCSPATPACTDPYLSSPLITIARPIVSPLGTSKSYPARFGHDQFYGYGRVNMFRAATKTDAGTVPPEVEITSPEWFAQLDPTKASFQVRGTVFARGEPYTCEVHVAPGSYPNDRLTEDGGDFEKIDSAACDGTTAHTGELDGLLADVDVQALRARFPANVGSFDGREPGTGAQTSAGRPNTSPYGFYVKVVAKTVTGGLQGEDRRNAYLHRDSGLLEDFPLELGTDGASSPLLVDLDGDNENELVFGTSDGFVQAKERDGSDVPGWPVRGDKLPVHSGGRAFTTGGVSENYGGAILASPAAGDLDRDGSPEIVAADFEGKVYAWNAKGRRVLTEEANPAFSGKPLEAFENVRKGPQNRTQHGFLGSPVLGDLDGDEKPEIVAAGMDRHLYAWHGNGSAVEGYPVLVTDKGKLAADGIDPDTHALTFDPAKTGDVLNQGAIVDTPAIANIAGDESSPPEVIVGTNEEYRVDTPDEGPFNAGPGNAGAVAALQQVNDLIESAGQDPPIDLANANGRVYAIHADGEDHAGGPYVAGWPVKLGLLMSELLPVVGEGVNGSPVVAPLTCPSGGEGRKVGVIPAAGLGYILNGDGSSCQPEQGGNHTALASDTPSGTGLDATRFPAVGLPAFGEVAGQTAFVAPVAGVIRALDLAANEYQGGADGVSAWNPATGQFLPGWPAQVNDLQFLTGPVIADVDGLPGEEVVAGTASMDLQAFSAGGTPASTEWPRLTGDWMVATPLIGSFGERETDDGAGKVVVAITRRGTVFAYETGAGACAPASSPRFHHDNANSGDYERDAVAPGKPERLAVAAGKLAFDAPGDDLLCGTAEKYEVAQSDSPIDGATFGSADAVTGAPAPGDAGDRQEITLPAGSKRYLAVRAVDEQGNVGRTAAIDTRPPSADPGGGPGGPTAGTPGAGGPAGTAPSTRCLPARLGVSASRVGPVRLRGSVAALRRRYKATSRRGITTFCVRGSGRRVVVASKKGRIYLIATTARRHATRQTAPGRRLPRRGIRGARRRLRGLLVGTLPGGGRIVYGVKRGRIAYLAVTSRRQARRPRTLARRLSRLGVR